jgi:hypothetical protein
MIQVELVDELVGMVRINPVMPVGADLEALLDKNEVRDSTVDIKQVAEPGHGFREVLRG